MITKCYYSCYKKDLAFEIYSRRQSDHLESFVGLGGSQAGLVLLFRHLARSFSRSNGTLVFGLNDLAKDFRGHKKDSMVDVCRSIFTSSFGFGGWSDWNFSSLPGIVPYHPENFHVPDARIRFLVRFTVFRKIYLESMCYGDSPCAFFSRAFRDPVLALIENFSRFYLIHQLRQLEIKVFYNFLGCLESRFSRTNRIFKILSRSIVF